MTRAARPGLLSAAIATTVAFAILIALGVWQLHRRDWKEGILAAVDQAERSPPVPLSGRPAPFSKVIVRGLLQPQVALYGVGVQAGPDGVDRMGAQRLQILRPEHGAPILVDLGWVPTETASPPVASGPATVTGYVRAPEKAGLFTPAGDPAARHFYTLDPAPIAHALGVNAATPYTLIAMGPPAPNAPVPATALPRPPNNHLQYAFTWFGLAGALLLVFGSYARGAP